MSVLQEKINLFQAKYGVTVSFADVDRIMLKFNHLNNFLFEKKDEHPNRTRYNAGLIYLLTQHIENNTKMVQGASYDLSKLNLIDFIREYEDMMQQKHVEENGAEAERERFEGLTAGQLVKRIKTAMKKYDKSLIDVWSDRLLNGGMKLSELKAVTDAEIQNIANNPEDARSAKNVFLAKQALSQACEERGVFWIIFHPVQYIKEKKYLKTLTAQVDEYVQEGKLLGLLDDIGQSVMQEAYGSIQEQMQKQQEKANAERANIQVNELEPAPQEQLSAPVQEPVQKQEPIINKN